MPKHLYPCVKCPSSCEVTLVEEGGNIVEVTGNTCRLGDAYVRKEFTAPERNVTTTVVITGAVIPRLPVRTSREVPKGAIPAVMRAASAVRVIAPIEEGTIVAADIAGTGADLIACRRLAAVPTHVVPSH